MARGSISHISLTVSDLERSAGKASLRTDCMIEMLLDLTIWHSMPRTDRRLRKCTSS